MDSEGVSSSVAVWGRKRSFRLQFIFIFGFVADSRAIVSAAARGVNGRVANACYNARIHARLMGDRYVRRFAEISQPGAAKGRAGTRRASVGAGRPWFRK